MTTWRGPSLIAPDASEGRRRRRRRRAAEQSQRRRVAAAAAASAAAAAAAAVAAVTRYERLICNSNVSRNNRRVRARAGRRDASRKKHAIPFPTILWRVISWSAKNTLHENGALFYQAAKCFFFYRFHFGVWFMWPTETATGVLFLFSFHPLL